MTAVVKAVWSGFTGSPGTSTFYVGTGLTGAGDPTPADLTTAVASIRQFFNACAGNLAASVVISFDGQAVTIDPTTGAVTGITTYTPPSNVAGTGASSVAAPAGASVKWITAGVVNGRRVAGRTYLVPLYAGAYEANGSLQSSTVSALATAAGVLVAASVAASTWACWVWHRPVSGTGGSMWEFSGSSVKDEVAVLTSRRN
jgi:hypothetical protein